jgi:hypothetical protein
MLLVFNESFTVDLQLQWKNTCKKQDELDEMAKKQKP